MYGNCADSLALRWPPACVDLGLLAVCTLKESGIGPFHCNGQRHKSLVGEFLSRRVCNADFRRHFQRQVAFVGAEVVRGEPFNQGRPFKRRESKRTSRFGERLRETRARGIRRVAPQILEWSRPSTPSS